MGLEARSAYGTVTDKTQDMEEPIDSIINGET